MAGVQCLLAVRAPFVVVEYQNSSSKFPPLRRSSVCQISYECFLHSALK